MTGVVDAVLEAYGRWGVGSSVAGEWGWLRQEARGAFHAALAEGDRTTLAAILLEPAGRYEWNGIASPCVDLDYDLAVWAGISGYREELESLEATPGELLSDSPRHDAEALTLLQHRFLRIVEIGGGYGGMAYRLWRRCPAVRYVDVDLADTLYLAYGFLAPRLPLGAVSLGYDPTVAVSLVPEHAIPADMGAPDVVVNYRGFGEMGYAVVARYCDLLTQWGARFVVHENAARCGTLQGTSAERFPELLVADYPPLPAYREVHRAPSPWSAGQERYVRVVLERR